MRMYQKVNRSEVLNKMGHVYERFRFLSRTRSLTDDQIEDIDQQLSRIIDVLNQPRY